MSEDKSKTGPQVVTWMIRCWEEPRDEGSDPPVFRCFVRDLKTGEERYLSDPQDLGELALRKLRDAGRTSRSPLKSYKTG